MSVPFGEASVLNDGRRVVAPWDATGLYVGDTFISGPQLRLPDAALTLGGRVWVVGAGQNGGLHLWSAATGWQVLAPGPFGKRTILRADGEGCRVAYANSPAAWTCVAVSPTGVVSPVSTGSVPGAGGGAGMRDWDAVGNPRTAAPVLGTLGGYDVRGIVTAHDVSIACALGPLPDQIVLSRSGPLGTLQMGLVESVTLRLSANGRFWAAGLAKGGLVPLTVPPLNTTVPIPAIGRPCWLGFFNFVPADTPGNCRLNVSDKIVRGAGGVSVAVYVAGTPENDLTAINLAIAAAKPLGLPIVAYWPRSLQEGPLPIGCDVVGVEAYRGVSEPPGFFEGRITSAVKRCPQAALICQAYSSNVTLTKDLASLPPIYARIAKANNNVWGLLTFSGSGRPTGLQDHTDIRPLWEEVAAGIPSAPPVEPPVSEAKATIVSFETPIRPDEISRAVMKVTHGMPVNVRWQWRDIAGTGWETAAVNSPTDKDHSFNRDNPPWVNRLPGPGRYPIRIQCLDKDGHVTDESNGNARVIEVLANVPPEPPDPQPQPPTPGPGEVVLHLTDMRSERPIQGADAWSQLTPTVKVQTDANGYAVVKAIASGVCVLKDGYHSPGLPAQLETCKPISPAVIELVLERIPPPPPPTPVIHAAGKIFRTATNEPWRWKGVSAFKLCNRFEKGENIGPFLDAYAGFNVLRVWAYTDWAGTGWDASPAHVTREFFQFCASKGFLVEYTLLTNDSKTKSDWAREYVAQLAEAPRPMAFIEGRNEPQTHSQTVSTKLLKPALDASGFVYASGNYEISANAYGPYLVCHTARDSEWPRKAHDLMEYFNGGGPHQPTDPAHKVPCIADEPAKTEDVAPPKLPLTKADDWRAYFGTAALLGAGATFHAETAKWAQVPTAAEAELAKAALEGLDAFPADAPLGSYSRPNDSSLRTYVVGNYSVRVRPTSATHPISGFTRIGSSNILWKR